MNPFIGSWIWCEDDRPSVNRWARFAKQFDYDGGDAVLNITADSRYILWVNGTYVGEGPSRCWPWEWRYDSYDIQPYLKSKGNLVAVLVQHYGTGTMQYIHGPEGLLAQIELNGKSLPTDSSWLASPELGMLQNSSRHGIQQGYEEVFDARLSEQKWTCPNHDRSSWKPAVELRSSEDGHHTNFGLRDIPLLTLQPYLPVKVEAVEAVKSQGYRWSLNPRPMLFPEDETANGYWQHFYLCTQLYSPVAGELNLAPVSYFPHAIKLNGQLMENNTAPLKAGWNSLMMKYRNMMHHPTHQITFTGPDGLKFAAYGEEGGDEMVLVGNFFGKPEEMVGPGFHDFAPKPTDLPSVEEGEAIWESGDALAAAKSPYAKCIPDHLKTKIDPSAQFYMDEVVGDTEVGKPEGFLSGNQWVTVPAGTDTRITLDFGKEMLGLLEFEVIASAGTELDVMFFEYIAPDGRRDWCDWCSHALRYVCVDGRQSYTATHRKGMRYAAITIRNASTDVLLRGVKMLFQGYPQSRQGSFQCSDGKLNAIWEVGAHSLRCCAEDTYTDCPTFERVHWVGDARNEALVDYTVNGDPRLWLHCAKQIAGSLHRSPIVESHVPSDWWNILPAWTALWMRMCTEYYQFTGDEAGAKELLVSLKKNHEGLESFVREDGLIEITGWNMFDWAPMDTPSTGAVVTHICCFFVLALRDVAKFAAQVGDAAFADQCTKLADRIKFAVNKYLWNDEKQAYTDALRPEGQSKVFSQQTQTVAASSGVAEGERAARCLSIIHTPPEGFVVSGSPFYEFFLLEALQSEGKDQAFIDRIRTDWGFMIDAGATTFWEMFSGSGWINNDTSRVTRSFCHGWSAAPTFFLTSWVLGVRPLEPGFKKMVIEPHAGDLLWSRGTVPTPYGVVNLNWVNEPGKPMRLTAKVPADLELELRLPEGAVTNITRF